MTSQIFMSAERAEINREENDQRTADLMGSLQRIGYRVTEVLGSYKGVTERSLMITLPLNANLLLLKNLAAVFQQESILRVIDSKAELIYTQSGEHVALGTLVKSTELPEGLDAWTRVPYMQSHYYLYIETKE